MIDEAFIQRRIRDVNPISGVDDINARELSSAVAAAQTRRAAFLEAPTHHETPELLRHTPLPPGGRRAWAFAAALALVVATIGAAALFLGGDNPPVADGPATPTAPEVSTTAPEVLPAAALGKWDWIRIDEPWLASVVDMAPLSEGGFVVATAGEWSVVWSPDGIDWRDADPRREVTVLPMGPGHMAANPQVVTTIGGRVVVLDRALFGVKVGELNTGSWDSIEFDTSDLAGAIGLLAVASNESHVLVIGYEDDYGGQVSGLRAPVDGGEEMSLPESQHSRYLSWLLDPRTGEVERGPIPASDWEAAENQGDRLRGAAYVSLAWFKDRWVLDIGHIAEQGFWFVSEDGTTWTRNPVPPEFDPGAGTLMAGPDALLAEGNAWGGLWYSEDGIDWTGIDEDDDSEVRPPRDAVAYSEVFGYLATPWSDSGLYMSGDGRTWHYVADWPGVDYLIASGDRAIGIDREFSVSYLFTYSGRSEGSGSNEAGPFVVSFTTNLESTAATEADLVATFRFEGRAIDDGVIRPSATGTRSESVDLGNGHEQWIYTMVCSDGSGTFRLDVDSRRWDEWDGWYAIRTYTVIDGSGAYQGMSGYGTGLISCNYGVGHVCIEDFEGTFRLSD